MFIIVLAVAAADKVMADMFNDRMHELKLTPEYLNDVEQEAEQYKLETVCALVGGHDLPNESKELNEFITQWVNS